VEGVRGFWFVVAVSVISSCPSTANECIAPKPPRISGPLCGRLIDASGAAIPNIGLRVLGESDRMIADVQADSRGDFIFPNLAKGRYRLKTTSPPWLIEFGEFEIKRAKKTCTNPVTVRLDFSCCCFGSGIIKKRPRNY
jgi:hypothetical protein